MNSIHPIPAGIKYEGRGLCLACFSEGVIVDVVYARDVCPKNTATARPVRITIAATDA